MVRIRLRRVGSKKQPTYRIVVTDSGSPRDGRFIERIGFYNPRTQPATVLLDEDRALYWLSVGAQPSEAVKHMMDKAGTMGRFDRFRKGEAIEALAAEAKAMGTVAIDPRTRRDDIKPQPKAKAQPIVEEVAVEEVEAPVAVAEVEAEPEPVVDEVPAEEGDAEAPAE